LHIPWTWRVQPSLTARKLALSLMAYGLIPTHSTFPGDPPERRVSIATDCQLVAEGFDEILLFVYQELHALCTIRIRHHDSDKNALTCLKRGYDAQGNPLRPHGYLLAVNGHNYQRQESKWVCRQHLLRFCVPSPSILTAQNSANSLPCSSPFTLALLSWPLFSPRSGLVAETLVGG
jgi:hypothetical protein